MVKIRTLDKAEGVIAVPGSKSYTNRALVIAALAKGKSRLNNCLLSDDTRIMIAALKQFGVRIDKDMTIHGGRLNAPKRKIEAGNAGTAMRFLVGLASLIDGSVEIDGSSRMRQRPIKDLLAALEKLGVESKSNRGYPPVDVRGRLNGGKTKLKGDSSSQYLSSILMCAPYARSRIEIEIINKLVSRPYVDITIDIMKEFGVRVNKIGNKFYVPVKGYSARSYTVEGEASSASYFLGAAAITGGRVKVVNINPESVQGDIKFADVLGKMGCKVRKYRNAIEVKGDRLKAIDIDMNLMPDSVQTLAVVALFAEGTTRIRNIANLRIKETDRISAIAKELRKLGARVKEGKDSLEITPGKHKGAAINTYNDHRMAMSFALAGLRIKGVDIKDPKCVSKSFPGFWRKFSEMYK